jgi:para-aminobenzoate synthetase/4-amino-4-deoxychorismate lyase
MGVGGGIVADSEPEEEYRECLLKAAFLTRAAQPFQLIETMLWDGEYQRIELHLERLEASALYFSFTCDREAVGARLAEEARSFAAGERRRVRLLLDSEGHVSIESAVLRQESATVRVRLSSERTSSADVFLRHKTTLRDLYEREHAAARRAGFDEAIFLNERGEMTEGAIGNVFVQREGKLLTPPLACGVLPGVFRRRLLETRADTEERVLRPEDLKSAEAVFLCNSVRGMRRVEALVY